MHLPLLGKCKTEVAVYVNQVSMSEHVNYPIFTDGSKDLSSGKAGFGVYIMNCEVK